MAKKYCILPSISACCCFFFDLLVYSALRSATAVEKGTFVFSITNVFPHMAFDFCSYLEQSWSLGSTWEPDTSLPRVWQSWIPRSKQEASFLNSVVIKLLYIRNVALFVHGLDYKTDMFRDIFACLILYTHGCHKTWGQAIQRHNQTLLILNTVRPYDSKLAKKFSITIFKVWGPI